MSPTKSEGFSSPSISPFSTPERHHADDTPPAKPPRGGASPFRVTPRRAKKKSGSSHGSEGGEEIFLDPRASTYSIVLKSAARRRRRDDVPSFALLPAPPPVPRRLDLSATPTKDDADDVYETSFDIGSEMSELDRFLASLDNLRTSAPPSSTTPPPPARSCRRLVFDHLAPASMTSSRTSEEEVERACRDAVDRILDQV